MSTYLAAIFEDEDVQEYVDSQADMISEAAGLFHETPQMVKDYIFENLENFVVPGDLKTTYSRMVSFVESYVIDTLDGLCSEIVGE